MKINCEIKNSTRQSLCILQNIGNMIYNVENLKIYDEQ